jgi:zinc protease
VLGTEEILKNFKYSEIRDFFYCLYRTDLQCIIVVGDFDADVVVEKIKKLFSDVEAVKNPETKQLYPLPKNTEPLIGVLTDPEYTNTDVSIRIKHTPIPNELRGNSNTYYINVMKSLVSTMASMRLREITQKPNAPFISGGFGSSRTLTVSDFVVCSATSREGESLTALESLYSELEKIRRFGFTESELAIAKAEYLKRAETAFNNRNDNRHNQYVRGYINNFKYNDPFPDAETEWKLDQEIASKITLAAVNETAKGLVTLENQVVLISAPEKAGTYPTETEVKSIIAKVRAAELEPYKDDAVKEPLIPANLTFKGSKVKKEEKDKFDATVWTLENGVKIVVKQTDFKADEVQVLASSQDGSSNVSDNDYYTADFVGQIMSRSGIGNLSAVDLRKQLAGKSAAASLSVNDYSSTMYSYGSPKDIETIMQLIYMNFTHPRWNEDDFNVFINNQKSQLKNKETDPDHIFARERLKTIYNNNPRQQAISTEIMDKIKFERLPDLHKQFFGNAANFVFTFVGNIDPKTLKPLVEKYIGSIPASPKTTHWKDDGILPVRGTKDHIFETKMQTPKTSIAYLYSGDMAYTLENKIVINVLAQILRIRYTEVIREEKGGTYGVRVSSNLNKEPKQTYNISISFDSEKEKVEKLGLLEDITIEFEKIAKNGPSIEDLNKIKEFLVKERKDDLKKNSNLLYTLRDFHVINFDNRTDYEKIVEQLSIEQIRDMAAKILNDKNRIRVIMNAKEE